MSSGVLKALGGPHLSHEIGSIFRHSDLATIMGVSTAVKGGSTHQPSPMGKTIEGDYFINHNPRNNMEYTVYPRKNHNLIQFRRVDGNSSLSIQPRNTTTRVNYLIARGWNIRRNFWFMSHLWLRVVCRPFVNIHIYSYLDSYIEAYLCPIFQNI